MQQAIYDSISNQINTAGDAGMTASRTASILRWVVRNCDMVGVMALMGSSAAYGVFALAHAGL